LMGLNTTLESAINRDYSEYRRARLSNDFIEGPRAFAGKRKPRWTGE